MMWDDNGYGGWRMMDGNGTLSLVLMLVMVALLVAGIVVMLVTARHRH